MFYCLRCLGTSLPARLVASGRAFSLLAAARNLMVQNASFRTVPAVLLQVPAILEYQPDQKKPAGLQAYNLMKYPKWKIDVINFNSSMSMLLNGM